MVCVNREWSPFASLLSMTRPKASASWVGMAPKSWFKQEKDDQKQAIVELLLVLFEDHKGTTK